VEQYVFNLDVSVRNAKRMHMQQTLAHIDKNVDNLGLSQLAIVLLQQVKQRAASAQLRQDVHAIRFSVMRHVFEFYDVLVSIYSFPDFYLVLDQGNKAFVLNHYLFKREFFTTHYISCSVDECETSFTEELADFELSVANIYDLDLFGFFELGLKTASNRSSYASNESA
jgi:hypothetical protein